MGALWIVISTRWGLSSVQASLNVIISVHGTIGLWAFTRFWWRRGCNTILRNKSRIPLHRLFSIAGIGEGWDTVMVLRRQIFAKQNWHLLLQLLVVVGVTLTCALAGPIAKVSLKSGLTVQHKQLQALPAVRGGGYFGNALFEEVLWNDTVHSLNSAGFPDNQLLDFLPPLTTPPWIYVESEWDPTWTIECAYIDDIILSNVTGSGSHDFYQPIDAFSSYRESYDAKWFNEKKYRVTSDFDSFADWTQVNQMREAIFVTLIQSDPEVDDRMYHNNDTLEISISLLHTTDFKVSFDDTGGVVGGQNWKPTGPIGHASYSRADCTITRKPVIQDPDRIPWLWTNDTMSIARGYTTYYMSPFFGNAVKRQPVPLPSARELLQFYQVYMASVNTLREEPVPLTLSVKVQTVELSVIFLVILIVLTVLTAWNSIRYAIFLRRNKNRLEELYLPDGRIEWMIHAVKTSEAGIDLELHSDWKRKDSELFCTSTIGADLGAGVAPFDAGLKAPRLARVQSCRSSAMSERPSRRFSASPARSNLGSVNEADPIEPTESQGPPRDESLHALKPCLSPSSHASTTAATSQESLPNLKVTTEHTPSLGRTASQNRTLSSTLSVPSPISPRSFNEITKSIMS